MSSALRQPAPASPVRWTVEDYFRMSEAGVFDGRRVELIDGEIIEVFAQLYPHRLAVAKGSRLLLQTFPAATHSVFAQATLVLSPNVAPDPDLYVLDVPEGTPEAQLPLPFLLIEVSDTTYRKDSGPKLRMYAAAGVADYWIVNLPLERVEVYRVPENPTGDPGDWRYATSTFFTRGQRVTLLARPDVSFDVDAMIP